MEELLLDRLVPTSGHGPKGHLTVQKDPFSQTFVQMVATARHNVWII
jgi:hypothetical protein